MGLTWMQKMYTEQDSVLQVIGSQGSVWASQRDWLTYALVWKAGATHLFLSENYECLKYILQKIITPYAEARIR